jgi:hypothetical protein
LIEVEAQKINMEPISHFASLIQDENDLRGILEKFQDLQVSSLFAKALVGLVNDQMNICSSI